MAASNSFELQAEGPDSMAVISPGTVGTFRSSTAEGRAVEVIVYVGNVQKVVANNPDALSIVTTTFNQSEDTISGSFSIPAEQTVSTGGSLAIAAKLSLIGVPIAPGGDEPTFKSSDPCSYLLEVLMFLQYVERISTRNPQSRNYISGTYNSDTGIYSGSFQLPVSFNVDEMGAIQITAQEYLTNA